jgi:UDP-N-acetylglucosamine--N-acetylmuramyl-(pentapeptide) pyrophosphoryl-undecaprenol N-acetylglucosamine transferase
VVPALAVAQALQAEGAQVEFIGGTRAEAQLVPAAGFALHTITVQGLSRSSPVEAARSLGLAAAALPRSRALLREISPDAVMGGGGYVAGPVGLAALALRLPLVLTEADSHLGLTNRVLARFSRVVCLAFPITGRLPPRYRVTGRPIPPPAADREGARSRFQIPPGATCVLVFGGSLGARSINIAALDALAGKPVHVLHVSGARDHAELASGALPAGYDLREYLYGEEFADALAAADLVIARSGGSVFEIAAQGLPSILIPYPHAAGDHQSANARWMADAGAALVISDQELSGPVLAAAVSGLLADPGRMAAMGRAALSLARPDAARDVARELLRAAGS